MPKSTWFFAFLLLSALPAAAARGATPDTLAFIKGADLSFIPQIEDLGGLFLAGGTAADPLQIMKERGLNLVRLKLWHTPVQNYDNLARVLVMARRIKASGLRFMLDFHYSDTWADPGHQTKPAAWAGLPFTTLRDSVFAYSRNVMAALIAQGTRPEIVQPGNEITPGLLWNDGRVGGSFETAVQWQNLAALLNAAIDGIRQSGPGADSVRIMIHIDRGGDNARCRWFFDKLIANKVPFDIIGLSYYPWWHGSLDKVKANLADLSIRYGKDLVIAETAYPWTLQWADNVGNIVGSSSQLLSGYPATVEGQRSFLQDLLQIVEDAPHRRGRGMVYWAPDYIPVPGLGSPWENNALFDFKGNVLSSMEVFAATLTPSPPIQVTMRLNTSTLMDTLQPWHMTQIRGGILSGAFTTSDLPDGRRVTWDQESGLWLTSAGGDYWQITFPMYPGDSLAFKFWSGFSAQKPTFQRLGWEGPVVLSEITSANQRLFVAGTRDTVLPLQYFNSAGEARLQYWQPFAPYPDSLSLFFRVNMAKAAAAGRFDPAVHSPVSVRGCHAGGSFDQPLSRETYSVAAGSFWSGVARIARAEIRAGDTLRYRFAFANAGRNGEESILAERILRLGPTQSDTTLHWTIFDNGRPSAVENTAAAELRTFQLEQNYPNPFNGATRICYVLHEPGRVLLTIHDVRGREVALLADQQQTAGSHTVTFNAAAARVDLPSGLYLCQLTAGISTARSKMILIR
ncbi:MAG TPA: glycosyl hydrolase 53 family protein [bacterium]|nr:glycosyl hydrolase 53 family protein [bacterium]HPR88720.1 glycosyl hydrolase 53 family protein [bacterium]